MDREGPSPTKEHVFVVSIADNNGEESPEDFEGVLVRPLSTCPHLERLGPCIPQDLPAFDSMCSSCEDGQENWVCLHCNVVLCSRYVNGHMQKHVGTVADHNLAFGLRDLSTWCFGCESYIDALKAEELRPYLDAYHVKKFGTGIP